MFKRTDRIKFHFLKSPFYFPKRTDLKAFLLKLFKNEGYKVEALNYIFCSDAYLLKINKEFLKHNTYTDIITFGFSKGREPVIADVYISIERVKENSRHYHSGFQRELHRVIFHGSLHLCGYKDKTAHDIIAMRKMEDHYLKKYFVSRETNSKS
jgi:probable rRNA maturation factor